MFGNNRYAMVDCTRNTTLNSCYDITLGTNAADCVCEFNDKTPVYILQPFGLLSAAIFILVSRDFKTLFMIAIL